MKLAILMNLAPRKLGSFEAWIGAMGAVARARGHTVDVLSRQPVHREVADEYARLRIGWNDVGVLERNTMGAIRRLARYDVVHLNMFAFRSRVALAAYGAIPTRVVYVDHSSGASDERTAQAGGPAALARRLLDAAYATRISAIVGVSNYVANRNRRRFSSRPGKVRAIYNGIDLRRFESAMERPRGTAASQSPLSVVAVAHLIREKGLEYLIRGAALAGDAVGHVRVVGDGPEQARLESLASELGIAQRVSFLGLRDDVHGLMSGSDVFVHPAVWHEAFGLTIAEAMACGRPIVASHVGAIPELIEDGASGLLVPPGDAPAIAAALVRLAADAELRARLGTGARRRAEQMFDVRASAEAHIETCEQVARHAGPARAAPRRQS